MLTQPHLLLNTPHPDLVEERRGAYMRAKNKTRSETWFILERISCLIFFIRLAVIFVIFLYPFAHIVLSSSSFSFTRFHNHLSSSHFFSCRWHDGRPLLRRNVPIKSESHVLPISRQLNLVHAHIAAAIAATRALCQGTPPANSADRRTLDEYSMPSS